MLLATGAYAQRSQQGGKTVRTRSYNKNTMHMPRSKSKVICPIFEDTGYPYQGIGVKFGDPFAFTYKYYPNKHLGIAVDFGRSASGLYSKYYSSFFPDYTEPDTLDTGAGESVSYYSHKVKSDWVGEVKFLYHFSAEKVSPGLQAYSGLGWEFRSLNITYDYQVQSGPENQIESMNVSRFTQGVQIVAGIEYSYFKLPISAFMELEYYIDVMKDPGWRKLQGGVGLRYIFE
ncbi:MAG TPA: hypothetical protein VGK39_09235 [Cyclobacteriaceae bacterium]